MMKWIGNFLASTAFALLLIGNASAQTYNIKNNVNGYTFDPHNVNGYAFDLVITTRDDARTKDSMIESVIGTFAGQYVEVSFLDRNTTFQASTTPSKWFQNDLLILRSKVIDESSGSFSSIMFSNMGNPLYVFTQSIDGVKNFAALRNAYVEQLVSIVPEPETNAMLLAGLGVFCFAVSRKSRVLSLMH